MKNELVIKNKDSTFEIVVKDNEDLKIVCSRVSIYVLVLWRDDFYKLVKEYSALIDVSW